METFDGRLEVLLVREGDEIQNSWKEEGFHQRRGIGSRHGLSPNEVRKEQ